MKKLLFGLFLCACIGLAWAGIGVGPLSSGSGGGGGGSTVNATNSNFDVRYDGIVQFNSSTNYSLTNTYGVPGTFYLQVDYVLLQTNSAAAIWMTNTALGITNQYGPIIFNIGNNAGNQNIDYITYDVVSIPANSGNVINVSVINAAGGLVQKGLCWFQSGGNVGGAGGSGDIITSSSNNIMTAATNLAQNVAATNAPNVSNTINIAPAPWGNDLLGGLGNGIPVATITNLVQKQRNGCTVNFYGGDWDLSSLGDGLSFTNVTINGYNSPHLYVRTNFAASSSVLYVKGTNAIIRGMWLDTLSTNLIVTRATVLAPVTFTPTAGQTNNFLFENNYVYGLSDGTVDNGITAYVNGTWRGNYFFRYWDSIRVSNKTGNATNSNFRVEGNYFEGDQTYAQTIGYDNEQRAIQTGDGHWVIKNNHFKTNPGTNRFEDIKVSFTKTTSTLVMQGNTFEPVLTNTASSLPSFLVQGNGTPSQVLIYDHPVLDSMAVLFGNVTFAGDIYTNIPVANSVMTVDGNTNRIETTNLPPLGPLTATSLSIGGFTIPTTQAGTTNVTLIGVGTVINFAKNFTTTNYTGVVSPDGGAALLPVSSKTVSNMTTVATTFTGNLDWTATPHTQ